MRIVFLTTDDPIYLPAFFDRVLAARGAEVAAVVPVPPLYKGQSTRDAVRRYVGTFGVRAGGHLAARVLGAKVAGQSVAGVCQRHGVQLESASDVNAPAFRSRLRALGADLVVSVSCPQLFEEELIALPELGCLNIHGAILPEYRGVMPSFWMLANGEERAGVSIFFVNDDIDAGDLCAQRIFPIDQQETLDEFLRRSKAIAAELLLETLGKIEDGTVLRRPLDLSKGSYFSWPDRAAVRRFRETGRRLW